MKNLIADVLTLVWLTHDIFFLQKKNVNSIILRPSFLTFPTPPSNFLWIVVLWLGQDELRIQCLAWFGVDSCYGAPDDLLLIICQGPQVFLCGDNNFYYFQNKKKWLISCSYNPKKPTLSNYIAALSKSIDLFTPKYEHLFFLSDFSAGMEDASWKM